MSSISGNPFHEYRDGYRAGRAASRATTHPTLAELVDAHHRMLQRIADSSAEMARSQGAGPEFARAARATLRRIDAAARIRAAMLAADR